MCCVLVEGREKEAMSDERGGDFDILHVFTAAARTTLTGYVRVHV